ncbi:MAG: aminopeptidase [Chloroflexota bacterium]|nr:aminopeptidase [Chloroflexota bacterium]
MTDPRLTAWARTLINYSTNVKPGDVVSIEGDVPSRPLLQALYREALNAGGRPVVIPRLPEVQADLLEVGSDEQIAWLSPVDQWSRGTADVYIRVMAEENTKALSRINPERQIARKRAVAPLLKTMMEREADGTIRWVLTLFPTDAYAQDAEMATDAFAEFVYEACKLNAPDPGAAWQEQSATQQRLIEWLAGKQVVQLKGPDTDLRVTVGGRTWINCDGDKNFPDGEIFTGPVENGTEGHVRFSYPRVVDGREIDDIRLRFEEGQVVDASAARGEEYLLETLDADPGARYLGEFAFGTNYDITRFTRNILFDEKIGGTVHMALGAGYPESGSVNESAIHWDLICDLRDGGEVLVDGEPFMRDGAFLV